MFGGTFLFFMEPNKRELREAEKCMKRNTYKHAKAKPEDKTVKNNSQRRKRANVRNHC